METITIIIICLIALIIQLLFCFLVKKLILKFIPTVLFLAAFIISLILVLTATGWDSLMYIVFVFISVGALAASAVGWVIWLIFCIIRKKEG